jgi:hypothetical protein
MRNEQTAHPVAMIKRSHRSPIGKSRVLDLVKSLLFFPDEYVGWYPFALNESRRLMAYWKPDLIYASFNPVTPLLLGFRLSKQYQTPWVAEMRDLWADNHYYSFPCWRRVIDNSIERRILRTAAGFVTVSNPLAETLARKYNKPTAVILNGFDPDDYLFDISDLPKEPNLTIAYTGRIYNGRRDPSPLFRALCALGPIANKLRVHFYGPDLGIIRDAACRFGLGDIVTVNDSVPHKDSLRIQSSADVLLLLLWDNPRERGVFTAKVFEYIGARRPILAIGPIDNVASELIRHRGAGFVSSDPGSIAIKLGEWLKQKARIGFIPSLPSEVTWGLSRAEQTNLLMDHLSTLLSQHRHG